MDNLYREKYRSLNNIITRLKRYTGSWYIGGTLRNLEDDLEALREMDAELSNELQILLEKMKNENNNRKREEIAKKTHEFIDLKIVPLYEPFEKEAYNYLTIDGLDFKFKALNYNHESILFGLFSFRTKQHAKSLISLINDGKSCQVRDHFYKYESEIKIVDKKKYKLQLIKSDGLNTDGYHGRLFLDKKNIIRIFDGDHEYHDLLPSEERIKDRFYNYLKNTQDAALLTLPKKDTKLYQTMVQNVNVSEIELLEIVKQWKRFFYDKFSGDYLTYHRFIKGEKKYLPKTYSVKSSMLDDETIRRIRTTGLKSEQIVLPIENTEINDDMTFLDVITKFVLKDIEDEDYHYNIGDPLEEVINSKIKLEENKTSHLFGKQKIIGQGIKNAMVEGENIIFLNGGTGIGKTFTSTKTSLQYLHHTGQLYKKFRIAIYAQGHLIPKWKRQIKQAIEPLGIKPIFRNVNYLKEVDSLPIEPAGAEFLFFSKDKAKRSYSITYTAENKYPTLVPIDNFIKKYKKFEDHKLISNLGPLYQKITIINAQGKIRNNRLKYAALRLGKFANKHVVIYNQISEKDYVFSTSIKRFNDAFSKKNHIKYFRTKSIEKPLKILLNKKNIGVLEDTDAIMKVAFKNPLVCQECGQPIFSFFNNRFKLDKTPRYRSYTSRSKTNSCCNAPMHPDGKPFSEDFTKRVAMHDWMKLKQMNTLDGEAALFLNDSKEPITNQETINSIMKGYKPRGQNRIYVNYVECGHSLWAADTREDKKDKMRNVNVGKHLKRRFRNKRFIDILIADECHIYSKQSNQGYLYHLLVEQSKKTMNLSATITGGKASDLYYTFWRTMPEKMRRMGYEYDDYVKFVENYGRYEKKFLIQEETNSNKSGTLKRVYKGKKEIPGISPRLYTNFLNNIMVSRKLEDMDIKMVELNTFKEEIEPDSDIMRGYNKIKDDILDFGKTYKVNIGGAFLHGLLSYLDNPNQPPITFKNLEKIKDRLYPNEYKELKKSGKGFTITVPPKIDLSNRLLNKEKALLKTLEREINQEKRKVLIYDRYSGTKGVSGRIEKVVSDAGFNVIQLKSKVPTTKREEWIEKKHQEGYDVIITNPKIVQTGLDIIQFPTIYFYNYDFDVKVIRQAEKRPWRPNQTNECRIYYSYYTRTIQQKAIQLIAKKKSASLALEGVFNEDMLSSMGSSEATSISKQLYDALKGKISLKEDHLDELNIRSSEELVNTLENNVKKDYNTVIDIVNDNSSDSIVKDDNSIEVKVDVEVAVGEQLSFF